MVSAIARVLWSCFRGVGFAEIGVLAFKCILYLFIEWSCGEDKADNMVLKIGIEKKKIKGFLNIYFQFLNNIIHIFTHFSTYTYF